MPGILVAVIAILLFLFAICCCVYEKRYSEDLFDDEATHFESDSDDLAKIEEDLSIAEDEAVGKGESLETKKTPAPALSINNVDEQASGDKAGDDESRI